ncbi:hypothetical protein [Rhodococcus sp. 66b]|uniref:hypothetical protein n=1 Tax=Rhodococcus sp. 66b TaxID=1945511 RepID=UPI0009BC2187|nr:hypothetical protein [Rhodococcus sp. 66b]OQM82054.1 hypothetical protein B0E55_01679 [Rhodococcus sp. 66b]
MSDIKVGDLVDLKPEVMFGPIGPPLKVTRITRNWLYARREGRLAVAVQVRIGDVTPARTDEVAA